MAIFGNGGRALGGHIQTVTKKTTYAKIDDHTLEITDTTTTIDVVVSSYVFDDLVAMRDRQVQDKQTLSDQKDVDIAAANTLITKATDLGIVPIVG